MITYFKKLQLNGKQWIFVIIFSGYTLLSFFILGEDVRRLLNYRQVMDHNKIGYQFSGLENILKDEKYVGYFSDIDLKNEKASRLFAQAQYVLAPAILDADNLNHPYVLLVYRNPQNALAKMKQLRLTPVLMNERNGVILAKKS